MFKDKKNIILLLAIVALLYYGYVIYFQKTEVVRVGTDDVVYKQAGKYWYDKHSKGEPKEITKEQYDNKIKASNLVDIVGGLFVK